MIWNQNVPFNGLINLGFQSHYIVSKTYFCFPYSILNDMINPASASKNSLFCSEINFMFTAEYKGAARNVFFYF